MQTADSICVRLSATCHPLEVRVIDLAARQRPIVETPEVKRRRLKAALRREREGEGLSQKQVCEALDWSVSKIIRIEAGAVGLTATDLRALMDLYKIADDKRRTELTELARGSRKQSWSEYSDVYSVAARTLFGYEAAASVIYKYEPTFIPGLLQTEEYARALLLAGGHGEDEIDRIVTARLERQELLEQTPRPRLEFILGEATVSRAVGSPGVMLHQLERLKDLARRPDISLQILLFEAGAHPRMGEAFTILEFTDENLDDLIYLENAGRESVNREDPEVVATYRRDFVTLQGKATSSSDFAKIIDKIAAARLVPAAEIEAIEKEETMRTKK
jgi:transcriptional regulator with XRE-family HTH domain